MSKPYIVGITGGSASGKTLFLDKLLNSFEANQVCLISQDNYYKPRHQQPIDDKGVHNFDMPGSIDFEQYAQDIKKIQAGETVYRQEYTFNNPNKKPKILEFVPSPVVVVEGIFVLYYPELANLLDLKVFIDAKEYIKLSDSLQQQERLTRNKLARIEYETDEIIVEKEAISNQFRIILIGSLLVFSFGILFYIILYQRSKHKELLFSQEQQKANEEIYKLMLDKQDEIDEVKKNEKLRISQELHDSIMNKLTGTRLNLFVLTKKRDDETIQKCLEHINGIQNIEKEIRTIAHELHNEAFLTKGSYSSLLEQLFQNQKETYQTECECVITTDEAIETISSLVKMNVYRIIQETLNNINKHAKATKISLNLYIEEGFLCLNVIDNGVGFKVSKSKLGIGLKNIVSRSQSINGKLEIKSQKNKGTKVCLKVKL